MTDTADTTDTTETFSTPPEESPEEEAVGAVVTEEELLTAEESSYRELSRRCRSAAERFSWRLLGHHTLSTYRERLRMLERSAGAVSDPGARG